MRDALNTITPNLADLLADLDPLLQLSINLWKTITPNKCHIYSTMHIYLWQIDPNPLQMIIDL